MPFRKPFFRRPRFGGRRRPNVLWSGNGADAETTLTAANSNTHEIIVPEDYKGGGGGAVSTEAGGCTLERIVLDMNLRATVVGALVFMYVAAIGDTEVPFVATALGTIISGDVLWQDHYMVNATAPATHVHADIRSRRRLEDDRVILIVSAVAQSITYTWNARALLRNAH